MKRIITRNINDKRMIRLFSSVVKMHPKFVEKICRKFVKENKTDKEIIQFFSKKNIDNFLIQNFTKKQKKLFKLNKINSIVLNLITYENNNCINEYNSIIDTIKDIYTIDK